MAQEGLHDGVVPLLCSQVERGSPWAQACSVKRYPGIEPNRCLRLALQEARLQVIRKAKQTTGFSQRPRTSEIPGLPARPFVCLLHGLRVFQKMPHCTTEAVSGRLDNATLALETETNSTSADGMNGESVRSGHREGSTKFC